MLSTYAVFLRYLFYAIFADAFGSASFSKCPPNWNRKAESNLLAKVPFPRELKRSYRDAVSTGAGTALVDRPPGSSSGPRPNRRPVQKT